MKTLLQLEKNAQDRRAEFTAKLTQLQDRLTLRGLADEAFRHFDPRFTGVMPVYAAVKRQPLLAASAIASLAWLFKQSALSSSRIFKAGKNALRPRGKIRRPTVPTSEKETTHEIE
jgi:hypothetical protein